MIPALDDVLSGYAFYARRYGLPDANAREVLVALKLAKSLAAFGVRWRQMALKLAQNQAANRGKILVADEDTRALIEGVRIGERSYEQVCLWMSMRLRSAY